MNIELNNGFYISDYRAEDVPALVKHLNKKYIYDHTLTLPYPYKESDAKWWIKRVQENADKLGKTINWCIRNPEGSLIGAIDFIDLDSLDTHKAELAYWVAEEYQGQGIATISVKKITEYGFDEFNFKRIFAIVFPFNTASSKVLEKNGFSLEGVMRNFFKKDNVIFDGKLYSKLR